MREEIMRIKQKGSSWKRKKKMRDRDRERERDR